MDRIRRFLRDTRGSTAIEYSMIACCIAVLLIVALTRLGSNLQQKFYVQIANGLN